MMAFFDYPKAARFGRVVPKSRIYDAARVPPKLRQLFVDQVDQIVWQFKLAPETINLSATSSVSEIQVFAISLRTASLGDTVLRAIDTAVAFPIIFELTRGGNRKAIAAFKRPSAADKLKWVVSEYFGSSWEPADKPRKPLPNALDLGALYDRLLSDLIPVQGKDNESLAERVVRMEAVRAEQREIARIKARLARERQFNKKVAINAELREVANKLKSLGFEGETEG